MMKRKIVFKSVIIFAIEILCFWMIWFAYSFAWLTYHDRISEILQVILIALGTVIILTFISAFIQWRNPSNNVKRRSASILMLLLFTIIHVGMFMSYRSLNNLEGKSVLDYIELEDFIDNRP